MTTGVSIVIPTWNGLDLLKRFLPSALAAANHFLRLPNSAIELIVVDDGGNDGTAEWLLAQGFTADRNPAQEAGVISLRYLRNSKNEGFGPACNIGVRSALYDLVFLLNNDAEPAEDAVAPLIEHFEDPQVFAVHSRVFDLSTGMECGTGKVGGFSQGFIRVHRSFVDDATRAEFGSREPLYSMFAGGGAAMFNRETFLELGGFEPLLSPFYWEDVDLSYRAWKRGYIVLYEPRSLVRHQISSTIKNLAPHRVRSIQQRNRLIYHWINLHDKALFASHVLWVTVLAATAPLRLQPEFVSGVLAALKMLTRIRERRREERVHVQRSDREVYELFSALAKRADIVVYDNPADLKIRRST